MAINVLLIRNCSSNCKLFVHTNNSRKYKEDVNMSKTFDEINKRRIEVTREKSKIKYENIDIIIGGLVEATETISDVIKKDNKEIESLRQAYTLDLTTLIKSGGAELSPREYDDIGYDHYLDKSEAEKFLVDNESTYEESMKVITDELGKLYLLSH